MNMTVVMVEPGKLARTAVIGNDLLSLQNAVGGNIQSVYPFEDEIALICNEEGKCLGLPANRAIYVDNEMVDIVCGKFFICGAPLDKDNFDSLSEEQIEKYKTMFEKPERFYKVGDTITAIKYIPEREEAR